MELLKDSSSDIFVGIFDVLVTWEAINDVDLEMLKSQDRASGGSEEEEVVGGLDCLFSNGHGGSSAVAMEKFGKVMLVVKHFRGRKKISAMRVTLKLQA